MSNQEISAYLQQQRDQAIASFRAAENVQPAFQALFAALASFDFVTYGQQVHDEILRHAQNWRTQETAAGQPKPLDAILFEFNSIYEAAVDARAYGIIDWLGATAYAEGFAMGYKYDFAKGFEAVPGISLSFLQPVEVLLDPETIDELAEPEDEMEDLPGFTPLVEAYLFSGLVVIHEVLVGLDQQQVFELTGLKPAAQFLLGGHDSGLVYPILTKA